jgi:iron(III) transport system ATP-binding protein
MMSIGIEFKHVTKRYTDHADTPPAVNNISFSVPQGTLTTLLGPSGCGKTTTLRMIAGLEQASSGQIFINGQDVTQLSAYERPVSLVFQSYALFPHLRVLDNVMYGLLASGVGKDSAKQRAQTALDLVGLKHLAQRQPSELSGGQQQRVAVARALVIEPSVLLFDEPLSNLDARLRRSMRDEIRALQQRLKLTVAYVTHDQSEALAVSDHIIVMNAGLIAQHGTPQDLYQHPQNAFVAQFMGDATLLDGAASVGTVRCGEIELKCDPTLSGAVKVAVRPHAWQISDSTGLKGTVIALAYQGGHYELTVKTAMATVLVNQSAHSCPAIGDMLYLDIAVGGYAIVPY